MRPISQDIYRPHKLITSVLGRYASYNWLSVLLFFAYGVFLFLEWGYHKWIGDFWEHAAVLRELSRHPFHPHHPVLSIDVPHAFFSPYLVFLGGISHYFNYDYFSVISVAGVINGVLFLVGVYLLCITFVPDSRVLVPIMGLVLSTFLWPKEFLEWSGFFQFSTIALVLSYPSTFAFDVSCILIYFTYSQRAKPTVWQALAIGLGTSIVILTHPLTALFLLIAIGAIFIEELATQLSRRADAPLRPILMIGIFAVVISLGIALTWPYYSIIDLVASARDTDFDRDSATLYGSFLRRPVGFVPFVIAAPFVGIVGFGRLRRHPLDRLCVTWGGLCAIYVAGLVFDIMGLGRVLSQIHMLSCLFIADGIRTLFFGKQPRLLVAGLASAVILATMVLLNARNVQPLSRAWRALVGEVYPWSELGFLRQYVGPDEIVLVNAKIGNMVAAFSGRVIASNRPLYWVTDAAQRREAISSVLDAKATLEERCRAMAAYRADFILTTPMETKSLEALKNLGTVLYEDKAYTLIRVSVAASPTSPDDYVRSRIYEACEKS